MKLEVNSQISICDLKPACIGSCTSKVSENIGYNNSVLDFHFFLRQNKGFCFREANCDHCDKCDKKCDTRDTAVFELFLQNCIFSKKLVLCCWQVIFESK